MEVFYSKIWQEEATPDNPFAAQKSYCSGYDVYGEMLGKASWVEYLYLLFQGERPSTQQVNLLHHLAVALANPGPRDHGVMAAMNAGVGGSTSAACLMAALAVGAGQNGGAHEVALAMDDWNHCGLSHDTWRAQLSEDRIKPEITDIWPDIEHPPGFDPNGVTCALPVKQTLQLLAEHSSGPALPWLLAEREFLESSASHPLSMTGVAAAALIDLGMTPEQGEMLFLLLRLPGAAVHALEQRHYGWRKFPFYTQGLTLLNDPGPKTMNIAHTGENIK